jgi:hypothetical protein
MIEKLLLDLTNKVDELQSVREHFENGSLTPVHFKLLCQVFRRTKSTLERADRLLKDSIKHKYCDYYGCPD